MKKLFTLIVGLFTAAAVFAAAGPAVMLKNNSNYRVEIDGRAYDQSQTRIELGNTYGYSNHTINVYEVRRGLFAKNRLISSKTFSLSQNDMMIMVDQSGNIRMRELGNTNTNRGGKGWQKNKYKKNKKNKHGEYDDENDDYGYDSRDQRNQERERRRGDRERRNRREF